MTCGSENMATWRVFDNVLGPQGVETIHTGQTPPSEGRVKLNVDGGAKDFPGPAGAGFVFRDEQGTWLLGFVSNIRLAIALRAKIMAL